jgi:DNA polymerase III sliding clamp (beta) subunit (PCNA family)
MDCSLWHVLAFCVSNEASGEKLDGMKLVIDTEAIRYSFTSADGTFPDYQKLIPSEAKPLSTLTPLRLARR